MAELHLDVISTASSKGLDEAQKELKETRAEADKLGKSFSELEADAFDLEAAIESSRLEVKRLAAEFKTTGDRSFVLDLKREKAWLSDLTRMSAAGAEAGSTASKGFVSAFDGAMSSTGPLKPILIGTLVGAAVAAAPTIISVIGGAVAGGIGTVGVAGGIAMAAHDPRVKSAAKAFGQSVSESFFAGGDVFVKPTVQSLAHLADVVSKLDLAGTFGKAAPHVTTIATGIGDLATNTMPGLNTAFERMGPFAAAAREGFSNMGDALSTFLDDVTRSEGTVEGLETGFRIVNNTIVLLGKGVYYASEAFETMNNLIHGFVRGALVLSHLPGSPFAVFRDELAHVDTEMSDLRTVTQGLRHDFGPAEGALRQFGNTAEISAAQLQEFNSAVNGTYRGMLDLAGAEVGAEAALDDLTEAMKEHGTTLDIDTRAGQENVTNLRQFAEAAATAREETLKQTGSVDAANAKYATYQERLRETLVQLGFTAEAAQALTDKWLGLASLPPVNLAARLTYIAPAGVPMDLWLKKLDPDMRAAGGPVSAGQPYIVGEKGPELFMPDSNGHIYPNGYPSGTAGGGVGGTQTIRLQVGGTPTQPLERMFMEWMFNALAKEVSVRGGELEVLNFKRPR